MITCLYKSKVSYGLEFIVQENNKIRIRLIGLRNVKGNLELLFSDKEVGAVTELKNILKPYQNLNISITGKGLLIKLVSVNDSISNTDILKQVIPGAKKDDYYCQLYKISTTQAIVTIIRRQLVDEYLKNLYESGYFINQVILGPFSACSLHPCIIQFNPQLEHKWQLESYHLTFEHATLTAVTKNNEEKVTSEVMLTGSEEIAASFIVAYATATFYFLRNDALVEDDYYSIKKSRESFKRKKLQGMLIAVLAIVIIAIAVLNALVFTYQFNQYKNLRETSLMENKKFQNYESLKQKFDVKMSIAKELGLLDGYNKGFILDQLALSNPPEIQWTKVAFNPLDEELLKSKRIREYIEKTIILEGTCQNPILVNNWLNELEKLPWVRDIKGQSFKYDEYKNIGILKFQIQLN